MTVNFIISSVDFRAIWTIFSQFYLLKFNPRADCDSKG